MNGKKEEKSSQRKTFFLPNNGSREIFEKSERKYVRFWNICLHIRLTVFLLAQRFSCFSPWSPMRHFSFSILRRYSNIFCLQYFPIQRRWLWKEIFSYSLPVWRRFGAANLLISETFSESLRKIALNSIDDLIFPTGETLIGE